MAGPGRHSGLRPGGSAQVGKCCRVWLPDLVLPAGDQLRAALEGTNGANLVHLRRNHPGTKFTVFGTASLDLPPWKRLQVVAQCGDTQALDKVQADIVDLAETACDLVADTLGLTDEQVQQAFEDIRVEIADMRISMSDRAGTSPSNEEAAAGWGLTPKAPPPPPSTPPTASQPRAAALATPAPTSPALPPLLQLAAPSPSATAALLAAAFSAAVPPISIGPCLDLAVGGGSLAEMWNLPSPATVLSPLITPLRQQSSGPSKPLFQEPVGAAGVAAVPATIGLLPKPAASPAPHIPPPPPSSRHVAPLPALVPNRRARGADRIGAAQLAASGGLSASAVLPNAPPAALAPATASVLPACASPPAASMAAPASVAAQQSALTTPPATGAGGTPTRTARAAWRRPSGQAVPSPVAGAAVQPPLSPARLAIAPAEKVVRVASTGTLESTSTPARGSRAAPPGAQAQAPATAPVGKALAEVQPGGLAAEAAAVPPPPSRPTSCSATRDMPACRPEVGAAGPAPASGPTSGLAMPPPASATSHKRKRKSEGSDPKQRPPATRLPQGSSTAAPATRCAVGKAVGQGASGRTAGGDASESSASSTSSDSEEGSSSSESIDEDVEDGEEMGSDMDQKRPQGVHLGLFKLGESCCEVVASMVAGHQQPELLPTQLAIDQRVKLERCREHAELAGELTTLWQLVPAQRRELSSYLSLCDYFVQKKRVGFVELPASNFYVVPPDKTFLAELGLDIDQPRWLIGIQVPAEDDAEDGEDAAGDSGGLPAPGPGGASASTDAGGGPARGQAVVQLAGEAGGGVAGALGEAADAVMADADPRISKDAKPAVDRQQAAGLGRIGNAEAGSEAEGAQAAHVHAAGVLVASTSAEAVVTAPAPVVETEPMSLPEGAP